MVGGADRQRCGRSPRDSAALDAEVFEAIAKSPTANTRQDDARIGPRRRSRKAVACDRGGHGHVGQPVGSPRSRPRRGQPGGDKRGSPIKSLSVCGDGHGHGSVRFRWPGGCTETRHHIRCPPVIPLVPPHSRSAWAMENPTLGLVLTGIGGVGGVFRVVTSTTIQVTYWPASASVRWIAVLGGRLVPPYRRGAVCRALIRYTLIRLPGPHGEGLVLVVNPAAGSGTGARVIDQVRRELPEAEIVILRAHDEVETVLRRAAKQAEVLGIGGGDGTVACAAAAAVNAGRPLAVFPAGTFNHFAKDIGCADPANTIRAIKEGNVSCVDLLCSTTHR